MTTHLRRLSVAAVIAIVAGGVYARAQQQGGLSAADKMKRWDLENELQSIATVERKVMMPMPDGVRLATDIYRPKNAGPANKVPIVPPHLAIAGWALRTIFSSSAIQLDRTAGS